MKSEKNLKKVSELLDELINKRNWDKNFALEMLKNDWGNVVGTNIADHTKPKFIKGEKLFIEVDSPIWSTQLNYLKKQIIDKINNYYKKIIIQEIFFNIKKDF